MLRRPIFAFALTVALWGAFWTPAAAQPTPPHWKNDWALRPGFQLERDTEGYAWPTAIAVVPRPGPNPVDPLYFVTELRGAIKVVTRDRQVHTFAENFFTLKREKDLPAREGQVGLAGICLDPIHGYVFVTFAYQDRSGVLRNNVARFSTRPGRFATTHTGFVTFDQIFLKDVAITSHQIGGCQVHDGMLYVGVGDGGVPQRSHLIDSTLGKILRLSLDGRPVPANPFYQDDRTNKPRNFVWGSGLRNPFSIEVVNGRVFVTENGPRIDRLVEVHRGTDYLWNGTEWSAGTGAYVVFFPAIGPVQMDYATGSPPGFPAEYGSTLFIAAAGGDVVNPRQEKKAGIIMVRIDPTATRLAEVPQYFLEHRGGSLQNVVGVAVGNDGLYVVPLYPDRTGKSVIYRIRYAPATGHPVTLGLDPLSLMRDRGCFGCHALAGTGGDYAPALDPGPLVQRLLRRLHSEEYLQSVERLDRAGGAQSPADRAARQEVLSANQRERVQVWIRHKIQRPRFDNPFAQMPNLGLSQREATAIATFLTGEDVRRRSGMRGALRRLRGEARLYQVFLAFGAGVLVTLGTTIVGSRARKRRKP